MEPERMVGNRTPEDARLRPIPGDAEVFEYGGTWTVLEASTCGKALRVSDREGESCWIPKEWWGMFSWGVHYIPAKEEAT